MGTTLSLTLTASAVKNDAGNYTQLRVYRGISVLSTYTSLIASSATNVANQFGYTNPNSPNSGFTHTAYSESYTVPAPISTYYSTTTYKSDGNYSAGSAKQNNKNGIDTRTALVRSTTAPQAASTAFSSGTYYYFGYYPYYWGKSSTAPTSATIAAAISGGTASSSLSDAENTITIDFNASAEYIWFAHYAGNTNKTKWYVDSSNLGNIGGTGNLFATPFTAAQNSPSSYWTGVNFSVYISNYATSTTNPPNSTQYMELRNT